MLMEKTGRRALLGGMAAYKELPKPVSQVGEQFRFDFETLNFISPSTSPSFPVLLSLESCVLLCADHSNTVDLNPFLRISYEERREPFRRAEVMIRRVRGLYEVTKSCLGS